MKYILLLAVILLPNLSFAQLTLMDIPYWRPYDKRGINIFETSKSDTIGFDGLKVRLGGAFTQQFQMLKHRNTAEEVLNTDGVNTNQLIDIGNGFNLATANLNLDVTLADGIRLNLITYLSSRHHPETWVKGGYIQIDKLPFIKSRLVDNIMERVTVRIGHMEINYGDAHFRRTDNANALYNPFVGNYIMDAFTTEIGSEVYYQSKGWIAMVAVTGGEIQGGITNPNQRKPSFYGKLGYDRQINENFRLRLTGSVYTTAGSISNTLYGGDRAGSRYYMVMENTLATTDRQFTSGRFNPGFRSNVTAFVFNPFVKFKGLELFGNIEQANGKAATEADDRTWTQIGIDVVYRMARAENLFVAARYNTINGKLAIANTNASIDRVQIGAGWFVTANILAKMEYVNQMYRDFNNTDIRNGGRFNGIMLEGVIAF